MIPGAQPPVSVRDDASSESGPNLVLRQWDPHRGDRALLEENARLAVENARLADENSALRDAADLWIRLYEKQLERANRAIRQTA